MGLVLGTAPEVRPRWGAVVGSGATIVRPLVAVGATAGGDAPGELATVARP